MQTTCSPIELRAHARLDDAASRCTPDSVLPGRPSSHARARRHLSLRVRGGGSSLGGCNPPSWSPLRREQTAPAGTACPTRLAPRQPAQSPGRRHYCRRRWALTPPFHPLPVPHQAAIGGTPLCCRLASPPRYRDGAPPSCFGGWPSQPGQLGRGVGKFLCPAYAEQRRTPCLHPRAYTLRASGSPGTRTLNSLLKRQVLCQLS